jgi:hypothetical protein
VIVRGAGCRRDGWRERADIRVCPYWFDAAQAPDRPYRDACAVRFA